MIFNARQLGAWDETRTARLHLGVLRLKWETTSPRTVLLTRLLSVIIYTAVVVLYATTSIASTQPDSGAGWWAGLLHGYFMVPSFVISLFSDETAVWQTGNSGPAYGLCFLIGVVLSATTLRPSR